MLHKVECLICSKNILPDERTRCSGHHCEVTLHKEDFDEFSDVEDLYGTLPMEKVEALEDMVSLAPSSLIKGVAAVSTTAVLSTKSPKATSPTQATISTISQGTSQDEAEETTSIESNPEPVPNITY
ncbi:CCR4-NOT transcription complex subunit 3 [Hordeum vulgare]|nr:CCR4-NOT transcription complex subunit 3 [Hordeum vulgare]